MSNTHTFRIRYTHPNGKKKKKKHPLKCTRPESNEEKLHVFKTVKLACTKIGKSFVSFNNVTTVPYINLHFIDFVFDQNYVSKMI